MRSDELPERVRGSSRFGPEDLASQVIATILTELRSPSDLGPTLWTKANRGHVCFHLIAQFGDGVRYAAANHDDCPNECNTQSYRQHLGIGQENCDVLSARSSGAGRSRRCNALDIARFATTADRSNDNPHRENYCTDFQKVIVLQLPIISNLRNGSFIGFWREVE